MESGEGVDDDVLLPQGAFREIGAKAVWSLSSAKPGNGVEQIRDGSTETYWQSDGSAPHSISIQFSRRENVSCVGLFLDFNLDESYTPKQLSVKAGSGAHDLQEVTQMTLAEPVGWTLIHLDSLREGHPSEGSTLQAFHVQISIDSMHQNGKDTHVRQCKIFGPKPTHQVDLATGFHFETVAHTQFMTIR